MQKVIFFNLTSLGGYFEGPNRNIDWHTVDKKLELKLINVRTFRTGNVLLTYELARK